MSTRPLETLTVAQANEIQERWMQLDSGAPEDVKQAVFADLKKFPTCYFSISKDGAEACIIFNGSPLCRSVAIAECLKMSSVHRVKTDLAWQHGTWIDFPRNKIEAANCAVSNTL